MSSNSIVPEIHDVEELKTFLRPIYFINDYMRCDEDYSALVDQIYTIVKGCFEKKDCREYMVSFKFYKENRDEKIHTLQLRHFLINLFMWHPLVNLYDTDFEMDENYIFDCWNEVPHLKDYIDQKIVTALRDYSVRNTTVNNSISNVLHDLRSISINFSLIMGLTMSSETFLHWYRDDPVLRELMETRFPLDMQPSEIEDSLADIQKRLITEIKSRKDDPVGTILRADTGIKHKQLVEFTAHMGLKPDLAGITIPLPINSSTLIRGLDKPSSHYIDALGARKSLIMNKKVMGNAGYFGKLVLLLARTLSLSKTVSDCGTKHYLKIYIKTPQMLQKYNNRYYVDANGEIRLVNARKDTQLIGTWVNFRSPITCSCHDEVCHVCFGRTSTMNFDISAGVVGFEVEEFTKVVNQMILSAKHLLTTVSEKINFSEEFNRFFKLYCGEVSPKIGDDAIPDIEDWAVWIDPTSVQKADELDEDSSFNSYVLGGFYVQNMKTHESIWISTDEDRELFLTDDLIDLVRKGRGYARFSEMNELTTLFSIVIMNNELTKPLYSLMSLLNSKAKADQNVTSNYHEMAQKFTDLLLDAKIGATALSGELIISRLIRKDPDVDFERPDFTKDEVGKYKILTVSRAIEHNKSPLLGFAGQDIKRQLMSDNLVTIKNAPSYIDAHFKKTTSTERFIEDHAISTDSDSVIDEVNDEE